MDVDWFELSTRLGGDEEAVREVVLAFLHDHVQHLTDLEAALSSSDAPALLRAAHTLLGASSSISLKAVQDSAARLQRAAQAQDWLEARAQWPLLCERLQRVAFTLQRMQGG